MARIMVAVRKMDDDARKPSDETKAPPTAASDAHVVRCKVCDTDINTDTGEPVDDAKNANDAKDDDDAMDTTGEHRMPAPIPTKDEKADAPSRFGPAYDAANGQNAITKALDILGKK